MGTGKNIRDNMGAARSASMQQIAVRAQLNQLMTEKAAEGSDRPTAGPSREILCEGGVCMVNWKPHRPAA